MDTRAWYLKLAKPSWAPPGWIFGPVWSVLYAMIFISYSVVFYRVYKGQNSWDMALPFVLNLLFNFAFMPLQFGIKSNVLAAIDIILVLGTLIWSMVTIYPHASWIAYVQIPYVFWVGYAAVLQLAITYLNFK